MRGTGLESFIKVITNISSVSRKLIKLIAFIIVIALLALFIYILISYCDAEPYAFQGAYLKYHISGPVNYTIAYRVESVRNNMMTYVEIIHYPNGTWENTTYIENVDDPTHFPAIPREKIGASNVTLFNLTFHLVGEKRIMLNNNSYDALEYLYEKIDMITDIFIDHSTGIILKGERQFHSYYWNFELEDTNIVSKNCVFYYGVMAGVVIVAAITMTMYWVWGKKRFKSEYE